MAQVKRMSAKCAEACFLLGVAFLIVRNNAYPWPVKRASDILFLAAAALLIPWALGEGRSALAALFKKARAGFFLIFFGLFLATMSGYALHGVRLDREGILNLGRLLEDALLFLMTGALLRITPGFVKRIAAFQLSTLVYLATFFYPEFWIRTFGLGRFALFENWPSNVGYYLIASLSCVYLLFHAARGAVRKTLLAAAGAGLSGILLWTQTRASWLGAAAAAGVIALGRAWGLPRLRAITAAARVLAFAAALVVAGYFLLPPVIKNLVIARVFPELAVVNSRTPLSVVSGNRARGKIILNADEQAPSRTVAEIAKGGLAPEFSEPSRLALWPAYASTFLREPLGLGLSYYPTLAIPYEGDPKGPHDTPLEVLALGGVVALAGFIALYARALRNLLSVLRAHPRAPEALYLLASLAGLVVASLFDNMNSFRLMWILLGAALFLSPPAEETKLG